MQVLLIEDDQFVADSLPRGLPRYGYEVIWAPTGEEALLSEPTGVVLLDLGLPDIDGLDVCRALRPPERCSAHSGERASLRDEEDRRARTRR